MIGETMQVMTKARDPKSFDVMEERIRENLVRFLADSGYSQNQLADLSGIPQANLGRYLRGENAVPAHALAPLAQVFGCSGAR
jgi:transcriptional regulator with XRE-family HTH domain